jgi:hypothetical protein
VALNLDSSSRSSSFDPLTSDAPSTPEGASSPSLPASLTGLSGSASRTGLSGSAAEAFSGPDWYPPSRSPADHLELPAVPAHELQAEQLQTLTARVGLRKGLELPIADLIKHGHLVGPDNPAWGRFENALRSAPVKGSLGQLSRSDATDIIGADVRKALPDASADRQADITHKLVGRVQEQLLYSGVASFKDQTVQSLEKRATELTQFAKDPAQVKALEHSLHQLDCGTAIDRQKAEVLRGKLGVEGKEPLAEELRESARNIRHAAHELNEVSGDRIFRALNGFEGRDELMHRAGIKPGSWAAQALASGQAKGVAEQKTIERLESALKWSSLLVMNPIGAAVVDAAIAIPEVGGAWNHASVARAAEASGVMKSGAAEEAEHEAKVKTGLAAFEVVGGPLVAKGVGDVLKPVLGHAAHFAGEVVTRLGIDKAERSMLHGHDD